MYWYLFEQVYWTEMAEASELKEYIENVTRCSICLEDLTNPKSLPCLHTFCLRCLEGHCGDKQPKDDVQCPPYVGLCLRSRGKVWHRCNTISSSVSWQSWRTYHGGSWWKELRVRHARMRTRMRLCIASTADNSSVGAAAFRIERFEPLLIRSYHWTRTYKRRSWGREAHSADDTSKSERNSSASTVWITSVLRRGTPATQVPRNWHRRGITQASVSNGRRQDFCSN